MLAVFAARTSGAEDGAPVAYLDEANLERLRQIMWDMNEVTWEVETQTHEVEAAIAADAAAEEDSDTATASVSESRGQKERPPPPLLTQPSLAQMIPMKTRTIPPPPR